MFKGLYLNKIHMRASDYCSFRLARNVPVAPLQNTRSRGRSWIPVQGAELDPGPGGGVGSRSRGRSWIPVQGVELDPGPGGGAGSLHTVF